ncbi:DNA-methyltransferase [Roseovarius tolerans]|nr:site-specific DNA-methyltransferase [Roseovarius tolerans]
MGDARARMVFTDPPYNVPINGHVRMGEASGHRDFAMGVGEMSDAQFQAFLCGFIRETAAMVMEGGICMICMDWRHVADLVLAGKAEGLSLLNLCVWNKTNGGMGSLYRSKHELVCVFKKAGASHVNNVELGRHGRYRTNVWDYAGVNTFRKGRDADLVDHPTVKPTALVADAVRDVSHRGEIVLDPFCGSGATLLAAEQVGRIARAIELDPLYVDVAIRRWQQATGRSATLVGSGETFADREQVQTPEDEEARHDDQ